LLNFRGVPGKTLPSYKSLLNSEISLTDKVK